jgi:hypothetical protein
LPVAVCPSYFEEVQEEEDEEEGADKEAALIRRERDDRNGQNGGDGDVRRCVDDQSACCGGVLRRSVGRAVRPKAPDLLLRLMWASVLFFLSTVSFPSSRSLTHTRICCFSFSLAFDSFTSLLEK